MIGDLAHVALAGVWVGCAVEVSRRTGLGFNLCLDRVASRWPMDADVPHSARGVAEQAAGVIQEVAEELLAPRL